MNIVAVGGCEVHAPDFGVHHPFKSLNKLGNSELHSWSGVRSVEECSASHVAPRCGHLPRCPTHRTPPPAAGQWTCNLGTAGHQPDRLTVTLHWAPATLQAPQTPPLWGLYTEASCFTERWIGLCNKLTLVVRVHHKVNGVICLTFQRARLVHTLYLQCIVSGCVLVWLCTACI